MYGNTTEKLAFEKRPGQEQQYEKRRCGTDTDVVQVAGKHRPAARRNRWKKTGPTAAERIREPGAEGPSGDVDQRDPYR
jgi:hypothetical protein